MNEGQEAVLPPSLVQVTGNKFEWVSPESNINRQLNDYIKMCDSEGQGYTTYSTRHSFKLYLQIAGINHLDILFLAGWAGNNIPSDMLKHNGRHGIGSPEMVKRLEVAVRTAMCFLNQRDGKIIQPYKS